MPRYIIKVPTDEAEALRTLGFVLTPEKEEWANIEFPRSYKAYRYKIPAGLSVKVGDRVTVDGGVFGDGSIGTVRSLTNVAPPVPYFYSVKAVA